MAANGSQVFENAVLSSCAVAEIAINGEIATRSFLTAFQCDQIGWNTSTPGDSFFQQGRSVRWTIGAGEDRMQAASPESAATSQQGGAGGGSVSHFVRCAVLDEFRVWESLNEAPTSLFSGCMRSSARLADALSPAVVQIADAEEAQRIAATPDVLRAAFRSETEEGMRLNRLYSTHGMFALSLRTPGRFVLPAQDRTVWQRSTLFQEGIGGAARFGDENIESRLGLLGTGAGLAEMHNRPVGFCPGLLSVSERAQVEARFPPACRVGRFLDAYGAAMEAGIAASALLPPGTTDDDKLAAFSEAALTQDFLGRFDSKRFVVDSMMIRSRLNGSVLVNATLLVANVCPNLGAAYSFSQGIGDVVLSDAVPLAGLWMHPFAAA